MVVFVMGYDYSNDSVELYTSYNHGWAFYQYLDEDRGIRWIYGKSGKQIVSRLETMLDSLENLLAPDLISYTKYGHYNPPSEFQYGKKPDDEWVGYFGRDCWDCSNFHMAVKNAHANAKLILMMAKKSPKSRWDGD